MINQELKSVKKFAKRHHLHSLRDLDQHESVLPPESAFRSSHIKQLLTVQGIIKEEPSSIILAQLKLKPKASQDKNSYDLVLISGQLPVRAEFRYRAFNQLLPENIVSFLNHASIGMTGSNDMSMTVWHDTSASHETIEKLNYGLMSTMHKIISVEVLDNQMVFSINAPKNDKELEQIADELFSLKVNIENLLVSA